MAGIKCPRLGLAQTGIWREIFSDVMSCLRAIPKFGLAAAGFSPAGKKQKQTKEFVFKFVVALISIGKHVKKHMVSLNFCWQSRVDLHISAIFLRL